jgi:hypothetical protein
MKQTLNRIKTILERNTNHCDYDYLVNLAQDLQDKITKAEKKCPFCKVPCPNKDCAWKEPEDEKK